MKTLAEITAELAGYDPQSVHVTDVVATTCALVADLRADPSNHETVDIGGLDGSRVGTACDLTHQRATSRQFGHGWLRFRLWRLGW